MKEYRIAESINDCGDHVFWIQFRRGEIRKGKWHLIRHWHVDGIFGDYAPNHPVDFYTTKHAQRFIDSVKSFKNRGVVI